MSSSIRQFQYSSDAINPPELQVWNNAAFENAESEDSTKMIKSSSWWTQSLESSCAKENVSPAFEKSSLTHQSSTPIKPLHSNTIIANSQPNNHHNSSLKIVLKQGGLISNNVNQEEELRKIDGEIEEIEKEIGRLSSRLEALRHEKAERSLRQIGTRGRFVPAKFMEPKQTVTVEEPPKVFNRRGVSLGPSEIYSGSKASNQEMTTPVSAKNRRKSCFWKPEEIDELKATKDRGRSLSVCARSHKNGPKIQAPKMAATTTGSRKQVKKEDEIIASIQPKKLFKDGERSVLNRKPGRVVPSRYNQIANNRSSASVSANEARKGSQPDCEKEDANKKHSWPENGTKQRIQSSSKVKKKWEIPSKLVVISSEADAMVEESSVSNSLVADELPKIKTYRLVNETPRDSGAAKRVADLVGKKFFFSVDETEEVAGDSVCQALRFDFEDEDVEEAAELPAF